MTEKEGQTEHTSFVDRYEQAKKGKPYLAELIADVRYRNFPPVDILAESNPSLSEQLQEVLAREKFRFLELCQKDVKLGETQAEVIKEVLSRTVIGFGIKKYLAGDDLIAEKHPELLLAAATYINSL